MGVIRKLYGRGAGHHLTEWPGGLVMQAPTVTRLKPYFAGRTPPAAPSGERARCAVPPRRVMMIEITAVIVIAAFGFAYVRVTAFTFNFWLPPA